MTSAKRTHSPVRRKTTRTQSPFFLVLGLGIVATLVVIFSAVWLFGRGTDSASPSSQFSKLTTPDFHSLAISPGTPSSVLFGHHGGVLASQDGGRTWKPTSLQGRNDDAMGMAFHPSDPKVVYAGGHNTLFASADGGQTWAAVSSDLRSKDIHGLTMVAADAPTLIANVAGVGLMQSTTAGRQWSTLAGAGLPPDIGQLTASGEVVYATSPGGVFRSDDGGQSFARLAPIVAFVFSAAAAPSAPDWIYVGTNAGLAVSTDGGATWAMRPLPAGSEVLAVAVAPQDSRRVVAVSVDADGDGHVFSSNDAGATWMTK